MHHGGCRHFTIVVCVLEGISIDMTQKIEDKGGRGS